MANTWLKSGAPGSSSTARQRVQPKQRALLGERIGEDGVADLIAKFRAGVTKHQLAEEYGCSPSTIERLLRLRGVGWRRS